MSGVVLEGWSKNSAKFYPTCRFFGCEPSSLALSKAKELDPAGTVDYRLGKFTADICEKIDGITCLDVFEHVPDQIQFLVDLKPLSDYKIFHIPLELSINWLVRSRVIAERRRMPGHLHYYTKDIALAVLREAGYEVLDWHYTVKPKQNLPLRTWIGNLLRKTLYLASPDKAVILLGGYSLMVLAK